MCIVCLLSFVVHNSISKKGLQKGLAVAIGSQQLTIVSTGHCYMPSDISSIIALFTSIAILAMWQRVLPSFWAIFNVFTLCADFVQQTLRILMPHIQGVIQDNAVVPKFGFWTASFSLICIIWGHGVHCHDTTTQYLKHSCFFHHQWARLQWVGKFCVATNLCEVVHCTKSILFLLKITEGICRWVTTLFSNYGRCPGTSGGYVMMDKRMLTA